MNGSMRKHRSTEGYIVLFNGRPGTLCYGFENVNHRVFLGGNPVTLFRSLPAAKRAIKQSKVERPTDNFQILRVASLVE